MLKNKIFNIIFIIVFNYNLILSNPSWNFYKGGADWPESCKDGPQAPIDISQPFIYKRKNFKKIYI
jgi:hypothetical protein